ncbi:MAG: hypothetical protein ABSB35_15985 [Bryobacteraceae bacterium]
MTGRSPTVSASRLEDIGKNQTLALGEGLAPECVAAAEIRGFAFPLEVASSGRSISSEKPLPAGWATTQRATARRYVRKTSIPVILTAVSRDADHGHVFVQDKAGPRIRTS